MLRNAVSTLFMGVVVFAHTGPASGQSELIPVPERNSHAFDDVNNVLYIAARSDRAVYRYDLSTRTMLPTWAFPDTFPNGLDVSLDGTQVFMTDTVNDGDIGRVRVIDTASGLFNDAFYVQERGESYSWDVATTDAGYALVSTQFSGTGSVPFRRLDEVTLSYSPAVDSEIRQRSDLYKSADAKTILVVQQNISSGPLALYDTSAEQFIAERNFGGSNSRRLGAVNRDGTLVAMEGVQESDVTIMNRQLETVVTLSPEDYGYFTFDAGLIFSPVADILFIGSISTDQILAISTIDYSLLGVYQLSQNIGEGYPQRDGVMSISGDGRTLFVSTGPGVSVLTVIPGPSTVSLGCLLAVLSASGRRRAGASTEL